MSGGMTEEWQNQMCLVIHISDDRNNLQFGTSISYFQISERNTYFLSVCGHREISAHLDISDFWP